MMTVERINGGTYQNPYGEWAEFQVGDHICRVHFGSMRQTWDCQPFRATSKLVEVDGNHNYDPELGRELVAALKAAYQGSAGFADLATKYKEE